MIYVRERKGGETVTTQEYIAFLQTKGFKLPKEALGFIAFGQGYTAASDELVNIAIETTLKQQFCFDGSYFIEVLERLQKEQLINKKSARNYVRAFATFY
ncbi:DUF6123 family protein [Ectobacillus sp. JY-23]|uniref:DUF6123 family protein n=1 Tax=Ectobacillus sp. JY-23 TaxID=2933872 RepID=UPI001FF4CA04|nr:DUF6123 family protein [Ectobacillus sp. JY-23]UOY93409.1 DUF6123 family protein [Ectobacillus sp. JY-23]